MLHKNIFFLNYLPEIIFNDLKMILCYHILKNEDNVENLYNILNKCLQTYQRSQFLKLSNFERKIVYIFEEIKTFVVSFLLILSSSWSSSSIIVSITFSSVSEISSLISLILSFLIFSYCCSFLLYNLVLY